MILGTTTKVLAFGLVAALSSCGYVSNTVDVTRSPAAVTTEVTKISPIAAKPNEVVNLTGRYLYAAKNLKAEVELESGEKVLVPLNIKDPQTASFIMPEGAGLGLRSVRVIQGKSNEVKKFSLIADQPDNQLPIIIGDGSSVCSDQQYIDRNGDTRTGTKDCAAAGAAPVCAEDGGSNCIVDGAAYVAVAKDKLTPGNIKSGVTIAGVPGQYPSSSFPLANASVSIADLSDVQGDRETQLRSATDFEFFKSDGTRVQAQGDSDIVAANIANGVNIFGQAGGATLSPANCSANGQQSCVATGTYFAGTACAANGSGCYLPSYVASTQPLRAINFDTINSWDLRAGVTVGSVTGKLKVNCRNRANGDVNGDQVVDIWDTIDDYNNDVSGLPPSVVTAWETSPGVSNTDCGGVEATAGDANVWKDVTTAGTGAAGCDGSPANCTMQDKITGLWWSKLQNFESEEGPVPYATWDDAWSRCLSLNHNGQTGWRLPTQKELMEAYTHGIRSIPSSYAAANTNWMTEANISAYFWSGSSVSPITDYAWVVDLAAGGTTYNGKNATSQVVCVR